MPEVRVVRGAELFDGGLAERIVELDRRNMRPVWEAAGMEYPEASRRRGLLSDPTFVIAFDGQTIAGYVEYLRSWNDPRRPRAFDRLARRGAPRQVARATGAASMSVAHALY
jgi:hypothetical protein